MLFLVRMVFGPDEQPVQAAQTLHEIMFRHRSSS